MLERTVGRAVQEALRRPCADDPSMGAFGHLGGRASAAIFGRTLRDVM